MTSNQYNITISPSDFTDKFYNDLRTANLLKLDTILQNDDKYFFRGNRRYEKSWWHWLSKFRYLYLIFDFTIEDSNILVVSNWYEGNINNPIANQNKQPSIPQQFIFTETNFHNEIKLIVNRTNQ